MNLTHAQEGKEYIVQHIDTDDEELNSFLFSLGCYSGEPITVVARRKGSCSVSIYPDDKGNIAQQTEDLVGPYALHDFFLYYAVRYGYAPAKIYEMCCIAFKDDFDQGTILKWLKSFYRRFFNQQFKRSCSTVMAVR